MANHFGASSPATMCKKVIAENPTAKEIECCRWVDWICSSFKTGASTAEKPGSPIQPRPRLAMVMPNWVALRYAFRWRVIWRARGGGGGVRGGGGRRSGFRTFYK